MAMYEIENHRSRQFVNLQPHGNTITVEAPSDNPFEDAQDVEVFTQLSGGFGGGPDPRMRSRRIITNPPKERIHFAGRARAIRSHAPAHVQHASFIPGLMGLGTDPAPSAGSTVASTVSDILKQAGGVVSSKFTADAQAAAARQADANARAEAARTERMSITSMMNNMGQHSGISGTLLAVAGVAVVGAVIMYAMKKRRK